MKRIRNKLIGVLLLASIGLSTCAYGAVLHQERTTQVITKGASLINDRLLMSEGWRNINILKINLDESNVELRPIESATGVERQTILQMTNNAGAIAGVNADYFDMGTSDTPSLGPVISDSRLKHGYNSNYSSLGPNKNMATFTIDTSNTPSMEYYGVSIRINSNGSLVGAAATRNNIPSKLTRPVIVDATYQKDTSTIIPKLKGTYTIVVEDDSVTYLSKSDEMVTIPKNGYVILLPWEIATEYYAKLPVGSTVTLEESLYLKEGVTTTLNNIKLGIGGGGFIMKDGSEYIGATHRISPSSQVARTVVATVKNSNDILLITIDGKGQYTGMKHSELVELLKTYNVKDAMYLDGGGSTTLVSRNEAEHTVKLQNTPSDGAQRKVVNGLGVFTTSKTGALNQLYIEPTYNRTFQGESIGLTLKGVDINNNPVEVPIADTIFTVTGVTGSFKENIFTPQTAGKAAITANYNGIETTTYVNVSGSPIGLMVEPSNIQMDENSTKAVQVYGVDAEGYKIPLKSEHITWTSDNSKIGATNNTVASTSKTLGTLTANYKGKAAKMGVTVGSTAVAIESFENTTAKWGGDNTTVTGKVEASKETKYHGEQALKMTYTFDKSSNKQVAYTVFEKPIEIPTDAMSINMWLSARKQGHVAKVEITDANGKAFYLKLADSLNFEGWKYVSANLPSDIVLPAKVTKFYTYANTVSEKITTAVNIDHVSITRGLKDRQGITVRDDYRFDPFYKESLQDPINGQYIINAVGPTKVSSMVMSKDALSSVSKQLSQRASVILQTSSSNSELLLSPTTYTYKNTYESTDYNNTKIIMAGTNAGGLRKTDEKAWLNIKKTIESTTAKNIILVMSKNPLTQFDDALEGQALHRYLKEQRSLTGKNIFVVYAGGTENEVRLEDGIRYIRTNGMNVTSDNYKDSSFVKFKVDGEQIYYTFEKFK